MEYFRSLINSIQRHVFFLLFNILALVCVVFVGVIGVRLMHIRKYEARKMKK